MSAGPISQERRGHLVPSSSVPKSERMHAAGAGLNSTLGKAYCGRNTREQSTDWDAVTCEDCQAARRADEAAS